MLRVVPPCNFPYNSKLYCRRELTRAGYFFDGVQFLITGGMGTVAVQFYFFRFLSVCGGGAGNVEGCSPLQFPLQFYIETRNSLGGYNSNMLRGSWVGVA